MNAKPRVGPLVGELIQLAGALTILITTVALLLSHRSNVAVPIVLGAIAYGFGRHLRRNDL